MSTAEAEALESLEDIDTAPVDGAHVDLEADDAEVAASVVEKATRTGWKPLDQFKGDPSKWVDAETFVKRAEEDPAIVRATNKQLEKALELANKRFETRVAQFEDTLAKFNEHHSKTQQREYARAMRDLEARQAAAVEANDLATVQETTKEIADLTAEVKAAPTQAPAPNLGAFKAANPWYEVDEDMTAYAHGLRFGPDVPPEEQFRIIGEKVKNAFPHKFENPNRKGPSPVAAATQPEAAGKTFADLPADAKQMCTQFERDIKGFKREQYVKDYFAS